MTEQKKPDITAMIACVRRELAMRQRVYPAWVSKGRMSQAEADRETNTMMAILATLERKESPPSPGPGPSDAQCEEILALFVPALVRDGLTGFRRHASYEAIRSILVAAES